MDVFLVPTGADRYDLYCEVEEAPHDLAGERPRGFFRRLKHGFTTMLAEAERERRHGRTVRPRGWAGRLKARMMRWVVESIAEQRLLWHLRRQSAACLFHPEDLDAAAANTLLRRQLAHDFDRHRLWLTFDSLALVASALLILVPGPNVVGYYFAFRVVGHYLSLRGARQGLECVEWRHEACRPLSRLREALAVEGEARVALVQQIASELHLDHLERFFARAAVKAG